MANVAVNNGRADEGTGMLDAMLAIGILGPVAISYFPVSGFGRIRRFTWREVPARFLLRSCCLITRLGNPQAAQLMGAKTR
jgi:hypothetical protein